MLDLIEFCSVTHLQKAVQNGLIDHQKWAKKKSKSRNFCSIRSELWILLPLHFYGRDPIFCFSARTMPLCLAEPHALLWYPQDIPKKEDQTSIEWSMNLLAFGFAFFLFWCIEYCSQKCFQKKANQKLDHKLSFFQSLNAAFFFLGRILANSLKCRDGEEPKVGHARTARG